MQELNGGGRDGGNHGHIWVPALWNQTNVNIFSSARRPFGGVHIGPNTHADGVRESHTRARGSTHGIAHGNRGSCRERGSPALIWSRCCCCWVSGVESEETDEAGRGSEMKTKSDRTRATAMGGGTDRRAAVMGRSGCSRSQWPGTAMTE